MHRNMQMRTNAHEWTADARCTLGKRSGSFCRPESKLPNGLDYRLSFDFRGNNNLIFATAFGGQLGLDTWADQKIDADGR